MAGVSQGARTGHQAHQAAAQRPAPPGPGGLRRLSRHASGRVGRSRHDVPDFDLSVYRGKGVFATFRETVLPELAEQVRASDATVLRCWSAGCVSGEEAYTVQLLWRLCLAERFPDIQLEIMATDADPHLIERARQGRYSRGSLKDLPPRWLEVGFERCGDDFVVRDTFREGIRFAAQDIRCEFPAGPFHLVLCRNLVFTYFADPVQRAVLTRIATRLAPGGILLVGRHEALPSEHPDWVPDADRQGFFH